MRFKISLSFTGRVGSTPTPGTIHSSKRAGPSVFRSGALQRGIFAVAYLLVLRNNSAEISGCIGCLLKVRPSYPEKLNILNLLFNLKGDAMKYACESAPSIEESTREADKNSSRRGFLQLTAGGALAGLAAAAGIEFASPRAALAQSKLIPDAALQELMDGNKR